MGNKYERKELKRVVLIISNDGNKDENDAGDEDDQDVWNGRGGSLYGVREAELVRCIPAYSTHTTLDFMMMIIMVMIMVI